MHPKQRSRDPAPPRRRQNRNCDQCREGKRRCDLQVNTQHEPPSRRSGFLHRDAHKVPSLPCTNCIRWKKRCTIEWIKSREKCKSPPAGFQQQGSNVSTTAVEHVFSPVDTTSASWRHDITNLQLNGYLSGLTSGETPLDFSSIELQSNSAFGPPDSYTSLPNVTEDLDDQRIGGDAHFTSPLGNNVTSYLERNRQVHQSADNTGLWIGHPTVMEDPTGQVFGSDTPLISPIGTTAASYFEREIQATNSAKDGTPQDPWHQKEHYSTTLYGSVAVDRAASPFTSQLLAEDHNRLSIKKGLMKIYHDSLEGALSCWLTERNCPYTSTIFDGQDVWSSNWANRIITRVCDLDKAYSKTGSLSAHDQQQASKVLNLVVMAFAAQWSQTGQRGNSRLPISPTSLLSRQSSASGSCDATSFEGLDYDIFGRNLQKSLWHEANKALCEACDNVSFRVILAGIIFSLTQRPIDPEVFQDPNSSQQSDLASLYKILDHDGPPIFLDVALRKLHDHQRKLEDAKHAAADSVPMSAASQQLPGIHKETFGLLYWLAVMFDTLSAAVNRRAFTVSDVDSNFNCGDSVAEPSAPLEDLNFDLYDWSDLSNAANPYRASKVNIWGDYFLRQKSQAGDFRKQNIRWPCSYIDAASCLADAAPVKVLLFRRVADLQGLFYQQSSAEEVEKGLEAAMEVYSHWNNTYGRFIDDCVRHHEDLPARIQSWYILLAGHWNLAVLIVSDLIQKLDDAHRTMLFNRRSRESIEFSRTLRARAAFAISELGRCSRYGIEDLTFSQSTDFHHAVNKAALLTEPWTMVLVRSFGYAGAILAKQVMLEPEPLFLVATGGSVEARKRLQYCIDALWLLGKKSDMAMCAAQVLQQAVE